MPMHHHEHSSSKATPKASHAKDHASSGITKLQQRNGRVFRPDKEHPQPKQKRVSQGVPTTSFSKEA
eukprot:3457202-Prorocentrum_lima.AAC.1